MYPRATTLARWLGAAALLVAVALPAQAQRNVTLRLNTATLPDTTKIDTDIQVRGCLQDCEGDQSELPGDDVIAWNDNTTLRPGNDGGDYWTVDFQIPDDQQLNFKFFSTQAETAVADGGSGIGGWEDGDNLTIEGGTGDVELDLHYFNKTGSNQEYDWRPFEAGGDSVAVWFRVYMYTEEAIKKGYDRDADPSQTIGVRGDAALGGSQDGGTTTIDWGATNITLQRERTDDAQPGYDLYAGRVAYPATSVGMQQLYKFFIDETNGWEDPSTGLPDNNRGFTLPAQDTTLMWVYYGDSAPISGAPPVTSEIVFQVNAEPLVDAGVLDLGRGDELQVRGGFNGWDCPDDNQDDCGLFRDPGTFNFGNVVPVTAVPGSESLYKYFAVLQNIDQTENPDFGYEEPLDVGGGNRSYTFAGTSQQELGLEFYNTVRENNTIPQTSVDVTFQVDMAPALAYAGEDAFDPETDTVYVAFEDQIWRLTQGYEPGDLTNSIDPDFYLENVGGTMYEGTFTVQGPTYNGIGYAYAWGSAGDVAGTTVREGAGGFEAGRRRYRYILPDSPGNFPTTYAFAQDVIVGADEPNRFECNPTDPLYDERIEDGFCEPNGYTEMPVGVEDVGGAQPEQVTLQPNYPNPFRATTTFAYELAESGAVRLEVYDLMGRRVATLVDGVQPASTYRVEYDASDLASGVYIVRLQTASQVVSRKITVMQ